MRKIIVILMAFILLFTGGYYIKYSIDKKENKKINGNNKEEESIKKDSERIRITAVGDILVHETQLASQYDAEKKKYDFKDNFEYVKPYIEEADYAIANLETTLAGEKEKFTGFPIFNSPDEILDALSYSGFNLLSAANNHILDKGASGLIRTAKVVKNKGFDLMGIKEKAEDKSYVVKEIKGIKFGFTNYVFETDKKGNVRTLNSLKIPNTALELFDRFNYSELEKDYKKMQDRIKEMKSQGAEVIIFSMHWGNEYERKPNDHQKRIANKLADMGVDVIIGGHPHVLQPMEYIDSKVSNKKTLVLYSLGNFLSNQRREIINNKYPEDGIIVNIDFKKQGASGVELESVSYIPTWVCRQPIKGEKYSYKIIPLNEVVEGKIEVFKEDDENHNKAQESYNETISLFESFNSKAVLAPVLK
ncbi:CapA family protein [Clostridium polynesiense]|uniref:CapA family protein n=1 Tax=Clostridium polynesiense TaxID=1325933 RepID=UPI000693486E|nr:CapA family protein [Clostridium polynesiense]